MLKPSVLVTFDSMKTENSGYYYFGKGLGKALIDKNHDRFKLNFYLHKRTKYRFGDSVNILRLSKYHRLFFPDRNRFDIVHFSDDMCRLPPNRVNAKKIMTIHDMNTVHLQSGRPNLVNSYLSNLRKLILQMDKVVAISQFVARDIISHIPEAEAKISVIYNGADKLIVPERHTPSFMPKKPFLFTIGILSKQKGFHLLPALLHGNDYDLVIAGIETPHRDIIIQEAQKYECLDRVHIIGPVSDQDKAWYYQNCSAFLFPSSTEGFGLPIIEAMHFGKPTFIARNTALPEVGGDVAYYFDNLDPDSMQKAFSNGFADFTRRKPIQAIINQAEKFTWDKAAKQYLALYELCLQ